MNGPADVNNMRYCWVKQKNLSQKIRANGSMALRLMETVQIENWVDRLIGLSVPETNEQTDRLSYKVYKRLNWGRNKAVDVKAQS